MQHIFKKQCVLPGKTVETRRLGKVVGRRGKETERRAGCVCVLSTERSSSHWPVRARAQLTRGWRSTGANEPGRPALIAVACTPERKLMRGDWML